MDGWCAIAICGRIVGISRLNTFAASAYQSLPFFFEFIISDGSDQIKAVAWNSIALQYYASLQVGYVIAIRGARVKT
jgi:hypothetical protein